MTASLSQFNNLSLGPTTQHSHVQMCTQCILWGWTHINHSRHLISGTIGRSFSGLGPSICGISTSMVSGTKHICCRWSRSKLEVQLETMKPHSSLEAHTAGEGPEACNSYRVRKDSHLNYGRECSQCPSNPLYRLPPFTHLGLHWDAKGMVSISCREQDQKLTELLLVL